MQFDRGYLTPYMVTDTDKMVADLDNAAILITDKKISHSDLVSPAGAGDAERHEAADRLRIYRGRGSVHPDRQPSARYLNVVAVKVPGFGDRRKEMLQDIAALTGGTVISSDLPRAEGRNCPDAGSCPSGEGRPRRTPPSWAAQATSDVPLQPRIAQIQPDRGCTSDF